MNENGTYEDYKYVYFDSACYLYDGGWRSTDRDALQKEYELADDEVHGLCLCLYELEETNR